MLRSRVKYGGENIYLHPAAPSVPYALIHGSLTPKRVGLISHFLRALFLAVGLEILACVQDL